MSLVIKDSEIYSAGKMISSAIKDLIELNDNFTNVLESITKYGYNDEKISDALLEKASVLSEVISKIDDATKDILEITEKYIDDIDEKDKYLF